MMAILHCVNIWKMLCIIQLCLPDTPSHSNWVCADMSDWNQKNSSHVVSQQVLSFLFDVAVSAKKQTSGGFTGSGM